MFRFPHIFLVLAFTASGFFSCGPNAERQDHVYYNGRVYTVDSVFSVVTAFAVKDGKISATGTNAQMLALDAVTKTDLKGAFVYPGFQDAHCHFYGYGTDKFRIWLTGTGSYAAILDTLRKYQDRKQGGWILGRGWDQNDWDEQVYPDKSELDSLFPNTPVFLLRVDGHAALANQEALNRAGITEETKVNGGIIERRQGKLTGLLIDHAVDLVYQVVPGFSRDQQMEGLLFAQDKCIQAGLTSVTDAGFENTGLRLPVITLIDSLQKQNALKMRINAFAAIEDFNYFQNNGKMHTPLLKVNGFKVYGDGALGSRGACLLAPYADKPGHYGFLIHPASFYDSCATLIASIGFQMCTHSIGDSSHRLIMHTYANHLTPGNNLRWRIEHAQVTDPSDRKEYKRLGVIPSVQPVHATSDMYWAADRLGPDRVKNAYAYRDLLEAAGMVAAGSDFPVESVNPLFGFYAAVSRKDQKNYPEGGFQPENSLTREQALRAMTIWAAYASFNEHETGSLEPGKYADFVITEKDLMNAPEAELWNIRVLSTWINGIPVYTYGK